MTLLSEKSWLLLLVGVVFHLTYLWSIFDIYFKSPIVHGMTPHKVTLEPPAKRLVLFVADGLRADSLFENDSRAPFLHSIIQNRGRWGISHTRVPTESRPGHVAIIAGFYEDVSAVTKGWKMNPVEFDSVFNESAHTWSFGSPDILPMFKYGSSNPQKVETFMYDHTFEDFASTDAGLLDDWVFTQVRTLFDSAKTNRTLDNLLKMDSVVFFLHLLGIDTNGHAHRPQSPEYLGNIARIDSGIKEIITVIEDFFGRDGRTSYILTADHGMSDIGNHGDANPQNTRTPLIAWGAGVGKPVSSSGFGHDEYSRDWPCNNTSRNDVNQADIAPLMSTLIGIPIPVNSVGVLPLRYLETSNLFKANALLSNSLQIWEQFKVKQDQKRNKEPFFVPYSKLNDDKAIHILDDIKQDIDSHKWTEVEIAASKFIDRCLGGFRYFQTYDWLFLRGIVSFGYLGWIIVSLLFVYCAYVDTVSIIALPSVSSLVCLIALASFSLYLKSAPYMYYAYVIFPLIFWQLLFDNRLLIRHIINDQIRKTGLFSSFLVALFYFLGLELLVLSYFYREILGFIFAAMASTAPWYLPKRVWGAHKFVCVLWMVSCVCSSTFLWMSVSKSENRLQFNCGAISIIAFGCAYYWSQIRHRVSSTKIFLVVLSQLVLVIIAIITTNVSSWSLESKLGLPVICQVLSWAVLSFSLILMFLANNYLFAHYQIRLLSIFWGFAPSLIMLTVNYETLFYTSFFSTLLLWLELELQIYSGDYLTVNLKMPPETKPAKLKYRPLKLRDIRIALAFLFYINCAFFGTGNMASIASFQISSVYRFITVFNPFAMGSLLLYKIMIPFFILSAIFGVLSIALDLPPFSVFMFTVATTDIITINFFYLVRDHGSWLEIGTSISHFVIACMFEILSVLLFCISWILIKGVFISKIGQYDGKKVW